MVSILMPARNADSFIAQSIRSVSQTCPYSWELLIVDDGSTDQTTSIVCLHQERWPQVKLIENAGNGKVAALNTAFAACTGDLVGTLDADDCVAPSYWDQIRTAAEQLDCFTRDAFLIDSNGRHLGVLRMNRKVVRQSFHDAARELTGLPRWTWTFRRALAQKLFPIPAELPFEDVWFSLSLKRFSVAYAHFDGPSYRYRQHDSQTYGGVFNYTTDLVRFRSWRLKEYARQLPSLCDRLEVNDLPDLSEAIEYHELIHGRAFSLLRVVKAKIRIGWKLKALLFRRFHRVATLVKRLQWLLDSTKDLRVHQGRERNS